MVGMTSHMAITCAQTLCGELYDAITGLVDQAAQKDQADTEDLATVAREAAQHWARCGQVSGRCEPCHHDPLQQLQDYVTGDSRAPLVLHGAAGCGKTTLLSQLALQVMGVRLQWD